MVYTVLLDLVSVSSNILSLICLYLFGADTLANVSCNISNTRDSVSSGYPNTEKRVENTTRSGVFLTKFEVFG